VAIGVGYRVRGQVVGIAGAPLPGVLLRARPLPDLGEPIPWWAVSDAEGRFAWDSLPAGPLRIEASGPGLLPSVIEAIAPSDDVLLVADGTAPLRGEVIAAVPGTVVRLAGSGIWPPRSVDVAADGTFEVRDVPLGVFGIEALRAAPAANAGAAELASVPLENVVRDELTGDVFVRLALVPAYRIPVRVLDGDGEPIAAARIVVGYDRVALLQRRGETDPSGLARVGPLVPGPYVVRAEAAGWLPAELELELGDADAPEQVLRLQRPSTVRGVVVDEAGATVAGARVRVDGDVERTVDEAAARAAVFLAVRRGSGSLGVTEGPVPPIPADLAAFGDALADGLAASDAGGRDALAIHSDADGAFELAGLGPGELRLQATDGRYAASPVVRVDIASAGAIYDVRLVLGRGQPVTGVVRDANGRPIAGASVQLDDGTLAITDARGTFDVGHRRGLLAVVVSAPGFAPARVEVRVRDRAVDLALELDVADAAIEGVVRDANGRPIAGATVMVRWDDGLAASIELTSDKRGVFEATSLPAGAVTLVVEGPGYGTVELRGEARARVSPLELALTPTVEVAVVVRDADSGRPVAEANVQLGGRTATTDAAGEARVVELDGGRGRWPLRVAAAGYVAAELDASAEAAQRDGAITVALQRGGAIEGVVQDDLGEAVRGAAISVRTPGATEVLARASTSGSGSFRIEGLPEGEVELFVEPPRELTVGERVFRSFTASAHVDARPDRVTQGLVLRFDRPAPPD
jgi:protocatechuate 3,4-dioxygenase beta subunit